MRYREAKKNSYMLLSNETIFKTATIRTVNILSGTYESKIAEDDFYVAAEIFIDLNLAPQERQLQIQTIIETFKDELKKAEAELAK